MLYRAVCPTITVTDTEHKGHPPPYNVSSLPHNRRDARGREEQIEKCFHQGRTKRFHFSRFVPSPRAINRMPNQHDASHKHAHQLRTDASSGVAIRYSWPTCSRQRQRHSHRWATPKHATSPVAHSTVVQTCVPRGWNKTRARVIYHTICLSDVCVCDFRVHNINTIAFLFFAYRY